jgi:hypothetical protein
VPPKIGARVPGCIAFYQTHFDATTGYSKKLTLFITLAAFVSLVTDTPLKIREEKIKAASKKEHTSLTEVVSRLRSSWKIRKETGCASDVYSVGVKETSNPSFSN